MPATQYCIFITILHLHSMSGPPSSRRHRFAPPLLCDAIRFGSARRTAPPLALFAVAQPILSARFGSQCASLAIRSLPLARKGHFQGDQPTCGTRRPSRLGAPATPGSPAGAAGDNSHALPALGPPAVPLPAVRPSQTPPPRRRGPRSPLAQPTGSPPVRLTAPPSHPPRPPARLPPFSFPL